MHDHVLEKVDTAKYLGVTVQKNMSWNPHINHITKKADDARAFLHRNLKHCPSSTKELVYNRSQMRMRSVQSKIVIMSKDFELFLVYSKAF